MISLEQPPPPRIVHIMSTARSIDEVALRYSALGHYVVRFSGAPVWEDFRHVFNDPQITIVVWELWALPPVRLCRAFLVFYEALDDDISKLLPSHRGELVKLQNVAKSFDRVLCHTPWMCERVALLTGVKTHLFPLGFREYTLAPQVRARFGAELHAHGTPERETAATWLAHDLGASFVNLTGLFDVELVAEMQRCALSLYVAHSPVHSFSTWRFWQALAAGTPIVTPPGLDVWPEIPGAHIVVEQVAGVFIRPLLEPYYFKHMPTLQAPEEWSTRKCVERYLLPLIEELK